MNCHGPYRVPLDKQTSLLERRPAPGFIYGEGPWKQIMLDGNLEARAMVTPEYLQSLREQYSTAVRYTLDEVGAFLDRLDKEGLLKNTIVVLTADHGEELYEHNGFGHGFTLLDEVTHVPLFIRMPRDLTPSSERTLVSLVDIMPTLCEVAGISISEPIEGRSLLPAWSAGGLLDEGRILQHEVFWPRRCVGVSTRNAEGKLSVVLQDYSTTKEYYTIDDGEPVSLSPTQGGSPNINHELGGYTLDFLKASTVRPAGASGETEKEKSVRKKLEVLGYF